MMIEGCLFQKDKLAWRGACDARTCAESSWRDARVLFELMLARRRGAAARRAARRRARVPGWGDESRGEGSCLQNDIESCCVRLGRAFYVPRLALCARCEFEKTHHTKADALAKRALPTHTLVRQSLPVRH